MFCSATPICSAIDMNRLLNTSSIIGSALVPIACMRLSLAARVSTRWFFAVIAACQPGSTTMVWCGSMMIAGPFDLVAGLKLIAGVDGRVVPLRRSEKNLRRGAPAEELSRASSSRVFSVNFAPPPTASTDTASMTRSLLVRSMKPNCALWAFSNARLHRGERCRPSTTSAVSVPA
mgnify:CR=1 FL=1